MAKVNSRKIRAEETKNRIYKSAEFLFRNHGFDSVSIDDIVTLADVAKGSFYVHFESKDAIIADVINDYVKIVDLDYDSYLKSLPEDMSVDNVLISLVGKITDVLSNDIGYENMQNLYKIYIARDVKTHALTDYNRKIYVIFNDLISKGLQNSIFISDLPPEEIARHFILALRGITFEWCIRYPDFDLSKQALNHFKLLLTGIAAK